MISFTEYLLMESFDIRTKPLRMSLPNMRQYAIEYLKGKYNSLAEKIYDRMLEEYKSIRVYKIQKSEQYIVFIMEKTDRIEIHFNNYNYVDNHSNLGNEKLSLSLFSDIFNIIYWYGLSEYKTTIISHPDKNRLDFYNKIVQKVLDKHKPNFECIIKNNDIVIFKAFNNKQTFTERFLLNESTQYLIDIQDYIDLCEKYSIIVEQNSIKYKLTWNHGNGVICDLTSDISTSIDNIDDFKNMVLDTFSGRVSLIDKEFL